MGTRSCGCRKRIPTFRMRTDQETGQTIISGMGELHLEIIVDRMLREFKVEANVGRPQVAYRETITRNGQGRGPLHASDRRQGPVWRRRGSSSSPLEPGEGFEFVNKIVGGSVPREYITRGGKRRARSDGGRHHGRLSGASISVRPCMTARTTRWTPLKWRSRSPVRWPSRRRCERARPGILEPIMRVEVTTPEEFMGDVIGDLNSAPRPDRRHGGAWQRAGHPRACAVGRDVRLRQGGAFDDAGSGL